MNRFLVPGDNEYDANEEEIQFDKKLYINGMKTSSVLKNRQHLGIIEVI